MVTAWLILAGVVAARTIRPFRGPLARHDRMVDRQLADWADFSAALRSAES